MNKLANGNQLTLLANISSGDQQSITTSTVLNNDPSASSGANAQRPLFTPRDTVRTPNIYQIDMRYTRTILSIRERLKVNLLAEANNVFNTRNVTTLNITAVTNAAGVITTQPTLAPQSTSSKGG